MGQLTFVQYVGQYLATPEHQVQVCMKKINYANISSLQTCVLLVTYVCMLICAMQAIHLR